MTKTLTILTDEEEEDEAHEASPNRTINKCQRPNVLYQKRKKMSVTQTTDRK